MAKTKRRTSKFERNLVAVFSDTHGGDKKGLTNPETMFLETVIKRPKDGEAFSVLEPRQVVLNDVQSWLWEVYERNIEDTIKLAGKDDLMVIHNGDLSQGLKYTNAGVADLGSQFIIAASNMRPWFKHKNLKWFKLVWGTASHIFYDGSTPIIVHDVLKKEFPNVDVTISKHSLINFFGVLMDIAHHGPTGGKRNWLQGNEARYYTKSIMADAVDNDNRPPDLVLRAHYHSMIEEYLVKFYRKYGKVKTEFVMTPSYQGINEFTRQVTQSKGAVINGHVVFEIINGKIHDTYWMVDKRDLRDKEVIR